MALDLDDQEQLDEFKAWWDKYGKMTISIILLALVAYASWQGYQYFQHKKAVEASDVYQSLIQSDLTKVDLVKTDASTLMEQYAGTPYAGRAAILLAKSNFEAADIKSAKSQLEWAVANAKESSVKAIASLELANLLLSEKDYAGAEKVLSAGIDPGYAGLKDDLQGDVYKAQGKMAEAKQAYESALTNLDDQGRLHLFTQQKLDSLGS
jgi:predicted negative regulator of RcsB-dependent stress response